MSRSVDVELLTEVALAQARRLADSEDCLAAFREFMVGDVKSQMHTTSHWTGLPALALLVLELGDGDADIARAARFLQAACLTVPVLVSEGRLHRLDIVGLAVGLGAFRKIVPGAFETAVPFVRTQMERAAAGMGRTILEDVERGGHCRSFSQFDLIQGAAGLVLGSAVGGLGGDVGPASQALLRLISWLGGRPTWWVPHAPLEDVSSDAQAFGPHANLSMAHGLMGILAALQTTEFAEHADVANARRKAVVWWGDSNLDVPIAWLGPGESDIQTVSGPRAWSWCYGSTGWSLVLGLGGRDELARDFGDAASELGSRVDVLGVPTGSMGLCHGVAGLYLREGLTSEELGRIDRGVGLLLGGIVGCSSSVLDHVRGAALTSLLEGANGVILARRLAHTGSSRTGWEQLLGRSVLT